MLSSVLLLLLGTVSVFTDSSTCPAAYQTILNSNLDSNIDGGCGPTWQYFSRPSGGWCMKFFPGTYSRPDAEAQCVTYGAVLSGIQTYAEVDYISNTTLAQITSTSGSVWLGLERTQACMKSKITATCTKYNSFYWTDNSTTVTDMFNIFTGPDNKNLGQPYAMMLVSKTSPIRGVNPYYAKQMDDVEAVPIFEELATQRRLVGFICGRKSPKQSA